MKYHLAIILASLTLVLSDDMKECASYDDCGVAWCCGKFTETKFDNSKPQTDPGTVISNYENFCFKE